MRNELNRYPVTYDEMSLEAAAVEIEQMARLIRTAPTLPNIGTFAACKFCGQLISVSDSVINELGSVEDAIEYLSLIHIYVKIMELRNSGLLPSKISELIGIDARRISRRLHALKRRKRGVRQNV